MQWILAGAAGVATIASPCVLPILPMLLGFSVGQQDRTRPLFIVLGFVLSFTAAALAFNATTQLVGLSPEAVRTGSTILLLLAGLVMLVPALSDRLPKLNLGIADFGQRIGSQTGSGPVGALVLGGALGAVWTPCAGPVLASVLALVATNGDSSQALPLLTAYAVGAGLPMLLIAYGGQTVMHRIRPLMKRSSSIRKGFGFAVVLTAVAMLAQVDGSFTAWVSGLWPKAEAVESRQGTQHALSNKPAPEFVGIDNWLNTPRPLSAASLKGKVVLVDFWTYSCINCIRTLPHIQKLHERYAAQGLVVVGMHTPEFPFERDSGNVKSAIKRYGLTYPVAQDNQYKTWDNYKNLYWPAQYLIGRNGNIVFQHYGEGDEALIEEQVRQALLAKTSG